MSEKVLYTGKTHTTGGKDGFTRSSDGGIDIKLPEPAIILFETSAPGRPWPR